MDRKQKPLVLLTGGTGLIGRSLVPLLAGSGYRVRLLSRGSKAGKDTESFKWAPGEGMIETEALKGVDHIVHLAGENIGSGRWTKSRKKKIIESRVLTTRLLFDTVEKINPGLKSFTSASATGYYGALTSEKIFSEDDRPGNDFAARVCLEWEDEVLRFRSGGYRTSIVRTGIVMSPEGGMMQRVLPAVNMHFLPLFGKGNHYLPWIHINDLCNIYLKIIGDSSMDGIYNAVAPEHIKYRDLISTLADVVNKRILMPPTPLLPWKLIFGEKSSLLLEGSRVSSEKISGEGFSFSYPTLKEALTDLFA